MVDKALGSLPRGFGFRLFSPSARQAEAPAEGATSPAVPAPSPAAAPPASQTAAPARAAVRLDDVGKRFGGAWVVRRLSFGVQRGSIFGLFGPSGAGKTTTLRLLLGLLDSDEGHISVLGTEPSQFGPRTRGRIGYMPQLFVLYPELSVVENLHLVAALYGMGWLRRRKPMRRVLEFVGLWEHRRKVARDLSGGMKRRLELACALVHEPELLVVDEPTAGVDPILRVRFWDHFRSLRDQGRTVIVTSQYVSEAEYCDRVAIVAHGRLVAVGSPDQIRRQAMGGEMIDVVADGLDQQAVAALEAVRGVRAVHLLSIERLRLTVRHAGLAIPQVLAALTDVGVAVKQVQEYRPNFDEVFVRLVEQGAGEPPSEGERGLAA